MREEVIHLNNITLASALGLDSLAPEDQQEFWGAGGGAQASFQWVESRKKNLHLCSIRRVDLLMFNKAVVLYLFIR